jgi:predicted nucleotidyltransferase component of viral defense system
MSNIKINTHRQVSNMRTYSAKQTIELFHLIFLLQFSKTVDKKLFVLKGGCNLRFFMQSIRYSQDMDLDIATIAKATLQKNVEKILASSSFQQHLKINNFSLQDFSAAKQTTTTQRWKLSLQLQGQHLPLHTKIEFSRRYDLTNTASYLLQQIDPLLLSSYALHQIFVNHYTAAEMLQQKILALALRNEVQARDIFDIHLLLSQGHQLASQTKITSASLSQATTNAGLLDYAAYKSQVVAYLLPEYQDTYGEISQWEKMQQTVIKLIAGLTP